jgi:hypothetical protein
MRLFAHARVGGCLPTSTNRVWWRALLLVGIWVLAAEGVGAVAERVAAEAEVEAEALGRGLPHGVRDPLVHRGGMDARFGRRLERVLHADAEGAQRGGAAAGEEGVADGAVEGRRRVGIGRRAAVPAVDVVPVVALLQGGLRLFQGHGVDGGEESAPPRREKRRARRLPGRQEGEDVPEHAVLQLAQAVAAIHHRHCHRGGTGFDGSFSLRTYTK